MMPDNEQLHRLSESEWYAQALRERAPTELDLHDVGCYDGEDVRVCFILKNWVGPVGDIVDGFVKRVWPEYRVIEHCKTRHGHIVTVEEGPHYAP